MSLVGQLLNRAPIDLTGARDFMLRPVTRPRAGSSAALSAMGAQSTLFAIVDRIAYSTSRVDWRLYRKPAGAPPAPHRVVPTDEGMVTRHPALTLWNRPNPHHTAQEFREATIQHFELVGEMPWVIGRARRTPDGPPIELWTVRPDNIRPVADRFEFINGWIYGTGLREVPLRLDQVIFTKRPHPTNPYRGIGPVQTLLLDLEGEKAATEFNAAFFRNGAHHGGLVIVEDSMTQTEFDTLVERWGQQHAGVNNAHRVGFLDNLRGAQWVDQKVTARDMQFEQLRRFSRDTIRSAFSFPTTLLGDVQDSNRAASEAAAADFAMNILRPRLSRLRDTLNHDLLPLFGSMGEIVEFDYVDPVEPDQAEARLDRKMKIDALVALRHAGFDTDAAADWLGLPQFPLLETPTSLGMETQTQEEDGDDADESADTETDE